MASLFCLGICFVSVMNVLDIAGFRTGDRRVFLADDMSAIICICSVKLGREGDPMLRTSAR